MQIIRNVCEGGNIYCKWPRYIVSAQSFRRSAGKWRRPRKILRFGNELKLSLIQLRSRLFSTWTVWIVVHCEYAVNRFPPVLIRVAMYLLEYLCQVLLRYPCWCLSIYNVEKGPSNGSLWKYLNVMSLASRSSKIEPGTGRH